MCRHVCCTLFEKAFVLACRYDRHMATTLIDSYLICLINFKMQLKSLHFTCTSSQITSHNTLGTTVWILSTRFGFHTCQVLASSSKSYKETLTSSHAPASCTHRTFEGSRDQSNSQNQHMLHIATSDWISFNWTTEDQELHWQQQYLCAPCKTS
jgi:hypothetical protein